MRENQQIARQLVRAADQRVVLMVLNAGARISEHHADGTVSIQALSGRVYLGLPTRSAELRRGGLLVLAPGLRHHVVATEESALLLTLSRESKS
jgi:quercetin dioxygenase-like cupin family protein